MMTNTEIPTKQLYLNIPQILVQLINAIITICIWGRGTGKSEGVIAPWLIERVFAMPRSKGILIGPTYQHILSNTLPQILEMWERMGYYRDVHYIIGRKPPKAWQWLDPYAAPLASKHVIYWFNGSCIVLVSQDRVVNSAGPSVDYIAGDEAKHLDFDKLQETFQTNRGNRQYFGHLACHHSILFCTDMPTSPKSKWIFEYENMVDDEAIELVLAIQHEIILLRNELNEESRVTYQQQIAKQIKEYENILNLIRMGDEEGENRLVYFSEFSTLENLEVVGESFIRDAKRNLPDLKFRASILNERVRKESGMFYPMLDEDRHYYFAFNYTKLDQIGYNFDQITKQAYHQDADVQANQPLDIALDYNAKINSLVVGQADGRKYRTLNFLFVLSPLMLKDVVLKFIEYYKDHPCKEVNYYYDSTAVGSNAQLGDYAFCNVVIDTLREADWVVYEFYLGNGPGYETRYEMFNNALRGVAGLPIPVFNRNNCDSLLTSMENTMTRQGKTGFEIDKRSENDDNIPPNHATHPQEAWGVLYYGRYGDDWNASNQSFDEIALM